MKAFSSHAPKFKVWPSSQTLIEFFFFFTYIVKQHIQRTWNVVQAISICCLCQLNGNAISSIIILKVSINPTGILIRCSCFLPGLLCCKSGLCSQRREKEWNIFDLNDYMLKIAFPLTVFLADFRKKIIKTRKYNIANLAEWRHF